MAILPNGSHVLLESSNVLNLTIVLAIAEHDFITWSLGPDRQCYWGHYFPLTLCGLQEATLDFEERSTLGHHVPLSLKGVQP